MIKFKIRDLKNKKWLSGDVSSDGHIKISGKTVSSEDFILCRSTGIRDKNNLLIFEGDILAIKTPSCDFIDCPADLMPRQRFLGKVKFKTDGSNPFIEKKWGDWVLDKKYEMEIIGNIYEDGDINFIK